MHLIYLIYFIYLIISLISLIFNAGEYTYLDLHPGVKKFKIYIFQHLGGVKHTGVILEFKYQCNGETVWLTKFDFGYGNKLSILFSPPKQTPTPTLPDNCSIKDMDLLYKPLFNYRSIQQYKNDFKEINVIYELGYYWNYLFNPNLPLKIMKDSTKYSLLGNNCRSYIIKLIERLSKGRVEHSWETMIKKNLERIQYNPFTLYNNNENCVFLSNNILNH